MDPPSALTLARDRPPRALIVRAAYRVQDSSVSAIKGDMRRLLAAVVLTTASFGAATASAQGVCIDDKAKQSLSCPGGPPRVVAVRKHAGVDVHTVQPPARTSAPARVPAPSATEGPRDDRKIRLEARQRALLAVEVQRIESLFAGTKRNAPDRQQIARRLADGYVELESAAFRDKTEVEMRCDALKAKNAAAAGAEQTQANEAERVMKGEIGRAHV